MTAGGEPGAPTLAALDEFVASELDARRFPAGEAGIVRPSSRPVGRMGLVLAPWAGLGEWTRAHALDALFVHRPWGLDAAALAADVGVCFAHRPFDERLTVGWNVRLAAALGLRDPASFAERDGHPLGMLADLDAQPAVVVLDHVAREFGGLDAAVVGAAERVRRVAVVGAMTDALVREAAARGATLYVTGQRRAAGDAALASTGLSLAAVGHARAERWGLRALAVSIGERWPAIQVVVADA